MKKMMDSSNCNSDSDKENQDDVFEPYEGDDNDRKKKSMHRYTRDQLFELRELPMSMRCHEHLLADFQNDEGLWDPELWHRSADREKRPSLADDSDNHHIHRRFTDPKERLKEESRDGIVLSPQRKSFVTGCHVTTGDRGQNQMRGREPSESESTERDSRDRREPREIPQRRIGSGRLNIDRDRYEERRFDDRRGGHDDHGGRRDDWRRDRGHEHRREEWTDYNGHNRHDHRGRGRRQHVSESEPEWFTAGPNSQSDTIELRGFNDRKEEPKEVKPSRQHEHAITDSPVVAEPQPAPSPKSDSASTASEPSAKVAPSPGADFDINELFNMDISGIRGGPSPVEGQPVSSGSRFSRWFTNQSSETASGHPSSRVNMDYDPIEDLLASQPRRSTSNMDESMGNRSSDMMFNRSGMRGDSPQMHNPQAMFNALMAGATPKPPIHDPTQSPSHSMEANLKAMFLASASQNQGPPENRTPIGIPSNRFKTVSELEAESVNAPIPQHRMPPEPKPASEMSAFNKLVGMMQMSGSLPDSKRESPNMDLLAAKYEQQQKQQLQQQLQAKLLQHQETMSRQNPTIITKPASPVPPMIGVQPNMSHQNTPRMVSPNPIMQQQHLLGQPSTPRAPSPIMFGQQPPLHLNAPSPVHPGSHGGSNQNLSVNSLQVNSGSHSPVLARVPSPQELVYHTQAIMQNALIKKQLEDQKERFIKKQQRDRSPSDMTGQLVIPQAIMAQANVPLSMAACVPPVVQPMVNAQFAAPNKPTTAFTPTSVIKKMAVERSNSKDKLKTESITSVDNMDEQSAESPTTDSARVMAVPPMPQQTDMRIRRALVGSGSMKALLQAQQAAASQQQQQSQSINNRSVPSKHMYQGPAGLTPMPTAIPRLNAPMPDKSAVKSPLIGRKVPPMGYNMPVNMMGPQPRHSMPGNPMLHLQALQQQQNQQQSNTARVPPMTHPALNQMNHLPPQLQGHGPMDPRQVRGYYPPMPGPRLPLHGMGLHRSLSPQPMMAPGGPRSPMGDNDLTKWFGMDMLKQQLPNMPPLGAQGQRVLTVDELERRQQVVS